MATMSILIFPDPRLRTKAAPVEQVDDAIRKLAADLLETMYAANGIGLAATQVNVHQRVLVADVSEERNQPLVLINPEIRILDPEVVTEYDEGCLSIPGFYETIKRPAHIEVTALDINSNPLVLRPEGMLAVCIQHETDHLDGQLFVDYLSPLQRRIIQRKLFQQQKLEQQQQQQSA